MYFINYKKPFLLHLLKMYPCCDMVGCAVVVIVSAHDGRRGIYWFEWKSPNTWNISIGSSGLLMSLNIRCGKTWDL